jgi:undecaprenyl-diphosphatase
VIERIVAADTALFEFLNGQLHHPVLDPVMRALTTQGNWYPILGGMWVALFIWGGRRGRLAAAMLIVAVALTDQLSCTVLKPLIGRLRPCNALPPEDIRLIVGGSKAFSFPSAHAANSFAMASVAAWRFKRWAPLCFIVAAAVGYSRIYVGLHYPLDVLGGTVLGLACGRAAIWSVVAFARWWERVRSARLAARPG